MAERMNNHILLQILYYQLNFQLFKEAQLKSIWLDDKEPDLNNKITIGILGIGYLGTYVGNKLSNLGYKVIGFKASKPKQKYPFIVFYKKKDLKKFLNQSDVVACILPSTPKTFHMIDNKFLNDMKERS